MRINACYRRFALALVVAGAGCAGAAASTAAAAREGRVRVGATAGEGDLAAAAGENLRRILEQAVRDSAFPGAVAIVGRRAGVLATVSVGRLDWRDSPEPDERTIWDIASLTKVVGTTSGIMKLAEAGEVVLERPVSHYLPGWDGPGKERVTVRHLLTHSSGLPAFRQFFRERVSPDSTLSLLFTTGLDTVAGSRMVYSDIGAVLLGMIVERVSGRRLDDFLAAEVFEPLGMSDTRFRPPGDWRPRIAPTEVVAERGGLVHGEVHDENAMALGGVAGHAGLFSSARDLARFARMYLGEGTLDGTRIFSPPTVALFTTRQDPALSHRALGWETPNGRNSAGSKMTPRAFGHTGFTGTSMWIDPANDLFVILLSNRVNPTRENTRIFEVRRRLADAMVDLVSAPTTRTSSRP